MEAVGLVQVKESNPWTFVPAKDVQISTSIPNCGSGAQEIVCQTKGGLLLHFRGSRLLRCFDLVRQFPGNGRVRKLECFLPTSGRSCVAVLQERACSIFEMSVAQLGTFVLRHQEKASETSDIFVYDFLRKGAQQLRLQIDNSHERLLDLIPGGAVVQVKQLQDGSEAANAAISQSVEKVQYLILKIEQDSILLENLIRSSLILLGGPSQAIYEESKLAESFFGGQKVSSVEKIVSENGDPLQLQVSSKLLRHSGKIVAIFKVFNHGRQELNNLTIVSDLSSDERATYKVDFSGTSASLQSNKSKKIIVQFDENYSRLKWNDPVCRMSLECQNSDAGIETVCRYPLPNMPVEVELSPSDQSNNERDKFLALKKIFVRQSLIVRTIFSDVRQFQIVCREKLGFEFSENCSVFTRSNEDKTFFVCKADKGQKQSMDLDLFGETESCLKSFLQTVYFHAPDDMIIQRRQNSEPQILGRMERYARAREKLSQEISALYTCLESSGKENVQEVLDHVEGTKSVYEAKRNAFKARSLVLKVTRSDYCAAKKELIRKEIESDFFFS